jgi:transposase
MNCHTAWHKLIVGGETMATAMLDARQEGDSYQRIEVITGTCRRRRWTAEEKARIVAESFETTNISEVARRNGVARGLLTVWRQKFAMAADPSASGFVPIKVGSERSPSGTADEAGCGPRDAALRHMASPVGRYSGRIEIEVSGARILVEPGVDARTLATVLSALRGAQ